LIPPNSSTDLRDDSTRVGGALVWSALAAATAVKLYLALTTAGTADSAWWTDQLATIRQFGDIAVYHIRGEYLNTFNHPPFMLHALRALGWLATLTHLPLAFWLRFACIAADAGSLYLAWRVAARSRGLRASTRALLVFALSPVAVVISGFHGNTDPVMIFFVMLAIYLADCRESAILGGLAFGAALSVKIVPLIFAPALWFYLPASKERVRFFGAAAMLFFVSALPYVLLDPAAIARSLRGYDSIYGNWGWSNLLVRLAHQPPRYDPDSPRKLVGTHAVLAAAMKWTMMVCIVVAAIWLNRRGRAKPPLVVQCGIAASLFLFLTPGFGMQYLSWLLPFVAAFGFAPSLVYNLAAGAYVIYFYTCYFYRSAPPYPCGNAAMRVAMLTCWCSVILLLFFYYGSVRHIQTNGVRDETG
jgi:hypothetical protein